MFSLNEIKVGRVLAINSEPYIVIKTDHHKMGRGGAVLKTKLRNLINSNILDRTFQGNDKAEEAQTETKKVTYMYNDGQEATFMDSETYDQFSLAVADMGEKIKFLKDGVDVDVLYFDNRPVAINIPIKVELKVTMAPPGIKGNSAGNVNKTVELETGVQIAAPMFINEGDIIKVNTDTGEYVERV
jgi:elongation factor P